MKRLYITCDGCSRTYEYENMAAIDRYPQPTLTVLNKEYCRMCLKTINLKLNATTKDN